MSTVSFSNKIDLPSDPNPRMGVQPNVYIQVEHLQHKLSALYDYTQDQASTIERLIRQQTHLKHCIQKLSTITSGPLQQALIELYHDEDTSDEE